MTRALTTAAENATLDDHLPAVVFVELDFSSGTTRVCNASHNVDWDGHTWIGAAKLGRIDPVKESGELGVYGLSMELSGIDTSLVSVMLTEHYQGRSARLWFAPLDADMQPVADPAGPFVYRMDVMSISLGETATLRLTAESRLADWDRPRVRRYNAADQQAVDPVDDSMKFVEQMAERQLVWGRG